MLPLKTDSLYQDGCILSSRWKTTVLISVIKKHVIITDLKKHTADENPDKSTLEKAIGSLKEVMT